MGDRTGAASLRERSGGADSFVVRPDLGELLDRVLADLAAAAGEEPGDREQREDERKFALVSAAGQQVHGVLDPVDRSREGFAVSKYRIGQIICRDKRISRSNHAEIIAQMSI